MKYVYSKSNMRKRVRGELTLCNTVKFHMAIVLLDVITYILDECLIYKLDILRTGAIK